MGCTALHLAATYNQRDVAATLIRKGVRILHADNSRCTALHQVEKNTRLYFYAKHLDASGSFIYSFIEKKPDV